MCGHLPCSPDLNASLTEKGSATFVVNILAHGTGSPCLMQVCKTDRSVQMNSVVIITGIITKSFLQFCSICFSVKYG